MSSPSPYGAKHAAERRRWEPIVAAGAASCVFCGLPIVDGKVRVGKRVVSSWHLDHLPGTPNQWRGPSHLRCNTRDGAIRGNRARGARRRMLRQLVGNPSRQW